MKDLQSLDLSYNSISIDNDPKCSWPTHLKELSLRQNNLGNGVFQHLSPHFETIDLSKTGITAITQDILGRFPSLKHLLLSSNNLQVLPVDLNHPTLLSLYVDSNSITSISKQSLKGLPNLQALWGWRRQPGQRLKGTRAATCRR